MEIEGTKDRTQSSRSARTASQTIQGKDAAAGDNGRSQGPQGDGLMQITENASEATASEARTAGMGGEATGTAERCAERATKHGRDNDNESTTRSSGSSSGKSKRRRGTELAAGTRRCKRGKGDGVPPDEFVQNAVRQLEEALRRKPLRQTEAGSAVDVVAHTAAAEADQVATTPQAVEDSVRGDHMDSGGTAEAGRGAIKRRRVQTALGGRAASSVVSAASARPAEARQQERRGGSPGRRLVPIQQHGQPQTKDGTADRSKTCRGNSAAVPCAARPVREARSRACKVVKGGSGAGGREDSDTSCASVCFAATSSESAAWAISGDCWGEEYETWAIPASHAGPAAMLEMASVVSAAFHLVANHAVLDGLAVSESPAPASAPAATAPSNLAVAGSPDVQANANGVVPSPAEESQSPKRAAEPTALASKTQASGPFEDLRQDQLNSANISRGKEEGLTVGVDPPRGSDLNQGEESCAVDDGGDQHGEAAKIPAVTVAPGPAVTVRAENVKVEAGGQVQQQELSSTLGLVQGERQGDSRGEPSTVVEAAPMDVRRLAENADMKGDAAFPLAEAKTPIISEKLPSDRGGVLNAKCASKDTARSTKCDKGRSGVLQTNTPCVDAKVPARDIRADVALIEMDVGESENDIGGDVVLVEGPLADFPPSEDAMTSILSQSLSNRASHLSKGVRSLSPDDRGASGKMPAPVDNTRHGRMRRKRRQMQVSKLATSVEASVATPPESSNAYREPIRHQHSREQAASTSVPPALDVINSVAEVGEGVTGLFQAVDASVVERECLPSKRETRRGSRAFATGSADSVDAFGLRNDGNETMTGRRTVQSRDSGFKANAPTTVEVYEDGGAAKEVPGLARSAPYSNAGIGDQSPLEGGATEYGTLASSAGGAGAGGGGCDTGKITRASDRIVAQELYSKHKRLLPSPTTKANKRVCWTSRKSSTTPDSHSANERTAACDTDIAYSHPVDESLPATANCTASAKQCNFALALTPLKSAAPAPALIPTAESIVNFAIHDKNIGRNGKKPCGRSASKNKKGLAPAKSQAQLDFAAFCASFTPEPPFHEVPETPTHAPYFLDENGLDDSGAGTLNEDRVVLEETPLEAAARRMAAVMGEKSANAVWQQPRHFIKEDHGNVGLRTPSTGESSHSGGGGCCGCSAGYGTVEHARKKVREEARAIRKEGEDGSKDVLSIEGDQVKGVSGGEEEDVDLGVDATRLRGEEVHVCDHVEYPVLDSKVVAGAAAGNAGRVVDGVGAVDGHAALPSAGSGKGKGKARADRSPSTRNESVAAQRLRHRQDTLLGIVMAGDRSTDHSLIEPQEYGAKGGYFEDIEQPFRLEVHPNVYFVADVHSYMTDKAEVIGVLAGRFDDINNVLYVQAAIPCKEAQRARGDKGNTDVEFDPMSQFCVGMSLERLGLQVVGWYHSHPKFLPHPSPIDITNHHKTQKDEESAGVKSPWVGLIVGRQDSPSVFQWFRNETVTCSNGDQKEDVPLPMNLHARVASSVLSAAATTAPRKVGKTAGVGGDKARSTHDDVDQARQNQTSVGAEDGQGTPGIRRRRRGFDSTDGRELLETEVEPYVGSTAKGRPEGGVLGEGSGRDRTGDGVEAAKRRRRERKCLLHKMLRLDADRKRAISLWNPATPGDPRSLVGGDARLSSTREPIATSHSVDNSTRGPKVCRTMNGYTASAYSPQAAVSGNISGGRSRANSSCPSALATGEDVETDAAVGASPPHGTYYPKQRVHDGNAEASRPSTEKIFNPSTIAVSSCVNTAKVTVTADVPQSVKLPVTSLLFMMDSGRCAKSLYVAAPSTVKQLPPAPPPYKTESEEDVDMTAVLARVSAAAPEATPAGLINDDARDDDLFKAIGDRARDPPLLFSNEVLEVLLGRPEQLESASDVRSGRGGLQQMEAGGEARVGGYGQELKVVIHALTSLGRYYARLPRRAPFMAPSSPSLENLTRSLAPTIEHMELPAEERRDFISDVALFLLSCFRETNATLAKTSNRNIQDSRPTRDSLPQKKSSRISAKARC